MSDILDPDSFSDNNDNDSVLDRTIDMVLEEQDLTGQPLYKFIITKILDEENPLDPILADGYLLGDTKEPYWRYTLALSFLSNAFNIITKDASGKVHMPGFPSREYLLMAKQIILDLSDSKSEFDAELKFLRNNFISFTQALIRTVKEYMDIERNSGPEIEISSENYSGRPRLIIIGTELFIDQMDYDAHKSPPGLYSSGVCDSSLLQPGGKKIYSVQEIFAATMAGSMKVLSCPGHLLDIVDFSMRSFDFHLEELANQIRINEMRFYEGENDSMVAVDNRNIGMSISMCYAIMSSGLNKLYDLRTRKALTGELTDAEFSHYSKRIMDTLSDVMYSLGVEHNILLGFEPEQLGIFSRIYDYSLDYAINM